MAELRMGDQNEEYSFKEPEQQASDRKALAEFLVTHNIRLESVGMHVPQEYHDAYENVVDGEVSEPPEALPSGE